MADHAGERQALAGNLAILIVVAFAKIGIVYDNLAAYDFKAQGLGGDKGRGRNANAFSASSPS